MEWVLYTPYAAIVTDTVYGMQHYHTSNSCECMGVNGEALQLHAVYKKPYFLLQVTRESVSVLSHVRIRIRYCKSHALRLNVQ